MKSPNNAAPAAAEAMEGSGGAKGNAVRGNAVRGSTCQTQSWESVSPALDRIRATARRDKRGRFTALLHHVTVDLLRWSFYQLRRRAAAGPDVTMPEVAAKVLAAAGVQAEAAPNPDAPHARHLPQ